MNSLDTSDRDLPTYTGSSDEPVGSQWDDLEGYTITGDSLTDSMSSSWSSEDNSSAIMADDGVGELYDDRNYDDGGDEALSTTEVSTAGSVQTHDLGHTALSTGEDIAGSTDEASTEDGTSNDLSDSDKMQSSKGAHTHEAQDLGSVVLNAEEEVPEGTAYPDSEATSPTADTDLPEPIAGGSDGPRGPVDPPSEVLSGGDEDEGGEEGERINRGMQDPSSDVSLDMVSDPELAELLQRGLEALSVEDLDKFLRANAPFSVGATVVEQDDGTEVEDSQYVNKLLLKEIPDYIKATGRANIPSDQATDLAIHVLGAIEYPDLDRSDTTIAHLTKAIIGSANGIATTPNTVIAELKQLITVAGENGVIRPALKGFELACQLGLSVEEGTELVREYINTGNYRQVTYNMWQFNTALQTLNTAHLDATQIKTVFSMMGNIHPQERDEAYAMFRAAVTFGCPVLNMTPGELMETVINQARNGTDVRDILTRIVRESDQFKIATDNPAPSVIVPAEMRARRFPEKPGRLENAALSYQTELSLNEGLRDLERLTMANPIRGDMVSEGAWTFDPDTNKWYSLGGETRLLGWGQVAHTHIPYDLSGLSEHPYQFHIHPEAAGLEVDRFSYVFPTSADYRSVAAQLDNAQRPVELRSFISHPLGITELTFPTNNTEPIRQVATIMDDLRTALFRSISDDERGIARIARQMGELNFTNQCVAEINRHLPDGFTIKWHRRGADLEEIIRQERS